MSNKKEIVKKDTLNTVPVAVKIIKDLAEKTPKIFIKKRKGKAGMILSYVEGGYMIKRLNEVFTPLGWSFRIIEKIIEPNEVAVLGELTVKFPNGFEITKNQFGTQERLAKMPLGDALKSAGTDSLKKCASLLGIALDVYSSILEDSSADLRGSKKNNNTTNTKKTKEEVEESIKWIKGIKHQQTLLIAKDRVEKSEDYTKEEKTNILSEINKRLKQISE